jgi:hypothetical protein
MANLTSLKAPVWVNNEQTAIDCTITLDVFGDEQFPFTASPLDVESHGRQIFADIVAGKYGVISPFKGV